MRLDLPGAPATLKGPTQIARARTEGWTVRNLFCPNCPSDRLHPFIANNPAADLFCGDCSAQYELKAHRRPVQARLVNGAYATLVARLASDAAPNLLLMTYDPVPGSVRALTVIPRRFLHPSIVEKRPPLAATARRAGWVGSIIRLDLVPQTGRIEIVRKGCVVGRDEVRREWKRTAFMDQTGVEARGWLADVLACVDDLGSDTFSLADIYAFEDRLKALHPGNRNVRPKIRQQLQVLRDNGLLIFEGRGRYRRKR